MNPVRLLTRLRAFIHRLQGDSFHRRGRRVVLLVAALCMLNVFDLICTMTVHDLGAFEEANPIARTMLHQPTLIIAFKLGMVTFASLVFVLFRRRRSVELACWGTCVVYVFLGLIWLHHIETTNNLSRWITAK